MALAENIPHTELRQRNIKISEAAYTDESIRPGRHVFVLTNRCNLKCAHCFQDRSRDANAMKEQDWCRVIDKLPRHSAITMTGGEPMLFKGFENVFIKATENHLCNIISNGLLLTEKRSELLVSRSNFRVLGISIDGTAPYMESIRGVDSEKLKKLETSLKYFKQCADQSTSKPILNIKTVILNENSSNLMECHRYACEELGADTHDFYFLKGSPIQHSDFAFAYDDIFTKPPTEFYTDLPLITDQLEQIREYDRKRGAKSFIHPDVGIEDVRAMTMGRFETENYKPCKFPWSSLHINHNGDVFPCLSIPIGNVKRESLEEVHQSDEYKRFKETIKESLVPACTNCGWLKRDNAEASPS